MAIELHQFPSDWDLLNVSPFCMKLEVWLQLAGVPYVAQPWSPVSAPKGKAPFVVVDGEVISDSSVICRELTERFAVSLDEGLSARQRAVATLIQRTLEEHVYWAVLHARWLDDDGWARYQPILGTSLPVPGFAKGAMMGWLRRGVRRDAHAQGLARHEPAEIFRRAIEDIDAVLEMIEGPFVLGEQPRSIDAVVYTFLAHGRHEAWSNPLAEHCRNHPKATAYVGRMEEELSLRTMSSDENHHA